MFAGSFGSTLLNVGHIILLPTGSMTYWNNCPLGKTPQAEIFKGHCNCTINDITQALSLLLLQENILHVKKKGTKIIKIDKWGIFILSQGF